MLDFIYYPVSAILWFWHKVFGAVLGPSNGFAWALSVVFLVFTLRAVLYRPFVKQIHTQQQMKEFQPQIKALQKKYKGDRQRLALEMQKLQKEHGFNPVAGCLPILLQAPVFIGLFHVLRSFNRTGAMAHVPFLSPTSPMSPEQNAMTPNYVFGVDDVQSFLSARLFGAPISSYITEPPEQLQAFGSNAPQTFSFHIAQITLHFAPSIAIVAIPMMVIASVATHFTARASVARQSATAAAAPQSAMMNKLVLWIFPLGVLVGGPFLPIAILLYWLSNNGWTLVQQHYVFGKLAAEEEAKKQAVIKQRSSNAPKPGVRPDKARKAKPASSAVPSGDGQGSVVDNTDPGSAAADPSGDEGAGPVLPETDSTTPLKTTAPSAQQNAAPQGGQRKPTKASGGQLNGRGTGKGQPQKAKSKSARGSRKKR